MPQASFARQVLDVATRQTPELSFLVDGRSLVGRPEPNPERSPARPRRVRAGQQLLRAGMAAGLVVLGLTAVSTGLTTGRLIPLDPDAGPTLRSRPNGPTTAPGGSGAPISGVESRHATRSTGSDADPSATTGPRDPGRTKPGGPVRTGDPNGPVPSSEPVVTPAETFPDEPVTSTTAEASPEPSGTPTEEPDGTLISRPEDGETVEESTLAASGRAPELSAGSVLLCLVMDESGDYFAFEAAVDADVWNCDVRLGPDTIDRPAEFDVQLRSATPAAMDEVHHRQEDTEAYAAHGLGPDLPDGLDLLAGVTVTRTR